MHPVERSGGGPRHSRVLTLVAAQASQLAERFGLPILLARSWVRSPVRSVNLWAEIPNSLTKRTSYFLISMWLSRRLGGITRSGGGVEGGSYPSTSDWLKFVDGGDYFMVDSVALKNSGW